MIRLKIMDINFGAHEQSLSPFNFERPRINQLFSEAVKYPVVMVAAGAGYGKTSAVKDFIQRHQIATAWVQLSERDNVGARFWENYSNSMEHISAPFSRAINTLGFPDTGDKINQFFSLLYDTMAAKRYFIVLDDFHLIKDQAVLRFVEHGVRVVLPGTTLIFISRSVHTVNMAGLVSKGQLFSINQSDLEFTEDELFQYFLRQGISVPPDTLRDIMHDTGGWAFAINLIARSYLKAPGYSGYARDAMMTNIFSLIESEIWSGISEKLRLFLIRLSLISHLSLDLVNLLSGGDNELIAELEKQNAYVHRDIYINAYLIHHLFLEFLGRRQGMLPDPLKNETYAIAGDWCGKNGFKMDALGYYEKTGDWQAIVAISFKLPTQIPIDIARYAADIFSRIPPEVFDQVDYLALLHVRVIISLGQWDSAFELMKYYEARYSSLPDDNDFRNHTLGGLYYAWGILRTLICTTDGCYNFDVYYAKQDECLTRSPLSLGILEAHPLGPWMSLVGSSRKGAPQEFNETLARAESHVSHCLNGALAGAGELSRGELLFYQGDICSAESQILRALEQARERRADGRWQYEIVHRALFYILRIAAFQGDLQKAQRALKEMETQLDKYEYPNCYITYDIALACYYCILGMPERIPGWLKDNFEPYGHAYFIENFGNQAKARYFFMTADYPPLLAYIHELKQRESILFGRIEMLAMEACVQYKLKNNAEAFASLRQAWEESQPNRIIMPFIELGKGMRTLATAALRERNCSINKDWLKNISNLSASCAKRRSHFIAEYRQSGNKSGGISLSARETDILGDLSHGLSRAEIAASRSLSINTVKMVIHNIYGKLGASNLADLIRIAAGKKMI